MKSFMEYYQTPLQPLYSCLYCYEVWSRNLIIKPLCKFKLHAMARNIENGVNNIHWRFSHWNKDRSKILFRSQQLHSSTSNGLSVLQCFEGTEFVIHLQEIIPTGRLYIRLLVFLIPGIKIKKYSPFSFPQQSKSLFSNVHTLRGRLLAQISIFLSIVWSLNS